MAHLSALIAVVTDAMRMTMSAPYTKITATASSITVLLFSRQMYAMIPRSLEKP